MVSEFVENSIFQKNSKYFQVFQKMDKNKCPKNEKPRSTFEKNLKIRFWREKPKYIFFFFTS
jgi:hypothetical protein